MTTYCVQILEARLHQIDVDADTEEAAASLAEAVFGAMSNRPAGEYGGAKAEMVTNVETGERWGLAEITTD